MMLEIKDGIGSEECLIMINGRRVLNCIGYEVVHDAARVVPKVILHLSPTKIKFKGTVEDLVLEREKE